ncbi:helix-turn-helix transcriptional regulator [Bifidobacterium sp. ESL0775]|uniref:helix-turn-helix domain-containing protein n=1 Tax=Bifidobacterium sp. ESL0775 TaxID=2983230 RepID=UPI0023F7B099|nr:helix-turn-helix transcriptional regulator [Bifidobacterium sp. ESL0775]WEV69157.1 helix-turn-helix transcriptional regulator [Bifidobacterium sp. ESL0775]
MYTVNQFVDDNGIDREKVAGKEKELREQMRIYELKEARKARHLSQRDLARNMGVSQKRISTLESGDLEHVQIQTLRKYLKAIGAELHLDVRMADGQNLEFA